MTKCEHNKICINHRDMTYECVSCGLAISQREVSVVMAERPGLSHWDVAKAIMRRKPATSPPGQESSTNTETLGLCELVSAELARRPLVKPPTDKSALCNCCATSRQPTQAAIEINIRNGVTYLCAGCARSLANSILGEIAP